MKNKDFKFVFFGTPEVASETLEILKNSGYLPCLIVTATDKPQGRKMIPTASPAKKWALNNSIEYIQPEKFNQETIDRLKSTEAQLFIVVAYGKILKEEVINMPALGSINIHYSLLPKYRGASPVEASILNGEDKTGVSIQQMEYKMDAGAVIDKIEINIEQHETVIELKKKLIKIGGDLLIDILPKIINKKITPLLQKESDATFCTKIKKEDGLIDLENDNHTTIYNKYKAYKAWPRVFYFENNKRVIVTEAILENNQFIIKKIIKEGKKEQIYK